MIAEFKIIHDPLRPSICTNLCTVCIRDHQKKSNRIGCCSYEPEFCLFDLVFLYLHYPEIYETILKQGQIIKGYNGVMIEMKTGFNRCPFVSDSGCVLPKEAIPPVCRLYICREAAVLGPSSLEEKFDEYVSSEEYVLNKRLNTKLSSDQNITRSSLHNFITEISPVIQTMIKGINRINPKVETFKKEIKLENFGVIHDCST